MEAAFVFGNVGNLAGRLGQGWSVEDQFAWTVGEESEFSLPLPRDEAVYSVRFDLHPLVYPRVRPSQRLIVLAAGSELGNFDLNERTTIAVELPQALTRMQSKLDLTLRHPDGIRPSVAAGGSDARLLSFCFHSASLLRLRPSVPGLADGPTTPSRAPVKSVIAGNYTALQLSRIFAGLSGLRQRLAVQYVDLNRPIEDESIAHSRICWLQSDVGRDAIRADLQSQLPPSCSVVRFPTPRCDALWPLQGPDPRCVADPIRYPDGRYPVGDRIAARLAALNIADDVVLAIYESMVEREMPDLDRALAANIAAWREHDSKNDIKLVDDLQATFHAQRLFVAPTVPGADLLRVLARRLLETPALRSLFDPATGPPELERLMEGYVGRREEVPIHPRVARHYGLAWWREDMTYRWGNSLYPFRDYIINYIRWAPWRP